MLYNLILEHWPLVSQVRQEWLDHFLKLEFDKDKARSLIYYLLRRTWPYKHGPRGYKNCELIFVDNPKQILKILTRYSREARFPMPISLWDYWEFDLLRDAKFQLVSVLVDALIANHGTTIVQQVYNFMDRFFTKHPKLLQGEAKDWESAIRLLTVRKLLPKVTEQIATQISQLVSRDRPFFPSGNTLIFSSLKRNTFLVMQRDNALTTRPDRALGIQDLAPYGDFTDFECVSLYDALQRCRVINVEGLSEYMELVRANVFSWIMSYGLAVVCRPPKHIKLDVRNRPHCVDDYAIKFEGGYGQFWVHGVNFDLRTFKKFFIKNRFGPAEVLSFPNVEQRIALIQHYGFEFLFDHITAKRLIDRDKCVSAVTGNLVLTELYDCNLDGRTVVRLLKLEDHSTHKPVIICVPSLGHTRTCKGAVAWTFGMTEYEYLPEMET